MLSGKFNANNWQLCVGVKFHSLGFVEALKVLSQYNASKIYSQNLVIDSVYNVLTLKCIFADLECSDTEEVLAFDPRRVKLEMSTIPDLDDEVLAFDPRRVKLEMTTIPDLEYIPTSPAHGDFSLTSPVLELTTIIEPKKAELNNVTTAEAPKPPTRPKTSKFGKKKIDIKRIRDRSMSRVCLAKRMPGAIKKLAELAILCGVEALLFARDPDTGNIFTFTNLKNIRKFLDDIMIQYSYDAEHVRKFTPESYTQGIANLHKIRVESIMPKKKSGRPRKRFESRRDDEEDEDDEDLDSANESNEELIQRAIIMMMRQLKRERYQTTNQDDGDKIYMSRQDIEPTKKEPYAKHPKKSTKKAPVGRPRKIISGDIKPKKREPKRGGKKNSSEIEFQDNIEEGNLLGLLTRLKVSSEHGLKRSEDAKRKVMKNYKIKKEEITTESSILLAKPKKVKPKKENTPKKEKPSLKKEKKPQKGGVTNLIKQEIKGEQQVDTRSIDFSQFGFDFANGITMDGPGEYKPITMAPNTPPVVFDSNVDQEISMAFQDYGSVEEYDMGLLANALQMDNEWFDPLGVSSMEMS